MPPLARGRTAANAPTLLDALARAPAAAALEEQDDRKALRLTHSQMRDAVGEATTKLKVDLRVAAAARPPTPARWPRLEELRIDIPDLATIEALGLVTWRPLRSLRLDGRKRTYPHTTNLEAPCARAFAAALRRMPALRALELRHFELSAEAAAALFRASSAEAVPQLRALIVRGAELTPDAARMIAATGWPLEELDLGCNNLGAAGLAVLAAAPTVALRRLKLAGCGLDAAALLAVANAPWPLEELDLSYNDFSSAAAGPTLAALSRLASLRRLDVSHCHLSAAGFKALVEATWPALTFLDAAVAKVALSGPHALGAAAFADLPALEELDLSFVRVGEAGAALLASGSWARLKKLVLCNTQLGDAGLTALARGAWPALERLDLRWNFFGAPPTLEDARRWAPALVEMHQSQR